MVLSGGLFGCPTDVNLEVVVSGEGDTLGILEGTGVWIKLGISDGEVLDASLGAADGLKPGVKEGSNLGLSGVSFEFLND